MAYNKNIEDEFPISLLTQISGLSNFFYNTVICNRDICINLNDYITLQRYEVKNGLELEGKDLFKYVLRNNYLQNYFNVTNINFFLYDYITSEINGSPFLSVRELFEDNNGNISYEVNMTKLNDELQEDIKGHHIPFFKVCSEYKFTAIEENFKIIDEVLNDLGISYKVIYVPNPYFPEYSNHITNILADSPFVYGMDFNEFEEKYHHEFKLNSNRDKDIDTISCSDEVAWLSSKYYEDVYRVKNIIKNINPLVEFGLGIDFYTHFGNYCSDKLLLRDMNLYSNFQEQILFNEDFVYPFVDFLYVDNINYDYCIKPSKDDPELALVDTRTINERIDLVCTRYKYPLDKIEVGFLGGFSNSNEVSMIRTIIDRIFYHFPYSLASVMFDENINRRYPVKESDISAKENYDLKKKIESFLVEEKTSVLEYLRKIYLIPVKGNLGSEPFNLNYYNGTLLYNLRTEMR